MICPFPPHVGQRASLRTTEDLRNNARKESRPYVGFATTAARECVVPRERCLGGSVNLATLGGYNEAAVDKHTMLLIGSAIRGCPIDRLHDVRAWCIVDTSVVQTIEIASIERQ